jgi:DNA-binding CsgD family transcriptional regulator
MVRPQRLVDLASTVLDKSKTTSAVFGVFRHERDGRVDDEMRRRLRLVVPHLRRAVLVGRTIELATVTAATFADALDSLKAGMFLVDSTRAIVHANVSGHTMLASGEVLRAVGGRLAANDAKSDHELRAVLAAASTGDAGVGVAGIAQPLAARDGSRNVAHVMPLTSGKRRLTGQHYAAVAALFVHEARLQFTSAPETIAEAYNLTPSEVRVLLAIAQEGGVPETAVALGINESTVRTHLQRVFAKTGTGRQADLVKLVAELSNPLVG